MIISMDRVMRKVLVIFLLALSTVASAQFEEEVTEGSSFRDRVFVGGNLGFQFGDFTIINVSPQVGYRFTNRLSGGVGVIYQYISYELFNGSRESTNVYGGNLFARYMVYENIFLQGEYEAVNWEFFNEDNRLVREWVPGAFLGGGFFQPIGARSGFSATALYNVLHDDIRSPYGSPWVFRVGFALGF